MNTLSKLATVQQIALSHFRTLYQQPDGGTDPIVDVAENGILQANALGAVFTDLSKRIAADELWPAHHTRPSSSGPTQPAAAVPSLPSAPITQKRSAPVDDPIHTASKKQKPATPPSQPPPPIALSSNATDPDDKGGDNKDGVASEIAYQDISAEVAARLTAKEARREEQTRHSLRKRKRKSSYATAPESEEPPPAAKKKSGGETKTAAAAGGAGATTATAKKTRTDAAELRAAKHADAVVDADAGAGADNGQKTDHGGKRAAGGVDQGREEAVAAAQDLTRRARRRQRSSGTVNQSEESGRSKKRARK